MLNYFFLAAFFFAAFFLAFFLAAIIVSFKVNLGINCVRRLLRTPMLGTASDQNVSCSFLPKNSAIPSLVRQFYATVKKKCNTFVKFF